MDAIIIWAHIRHTPRTRILLGCPLIPFRLFLFGSFFYFTFINICHFRIFFVFYYQFQFSVTSHAQALKYCVARFCGWWQEKNHFRNGIQHINLWYFRLSIDKNSTFLLCLRCNKCLPLKVTYTEEKARLVLANKMNGTRITKTNYRKRQP